MKGLKAVFAVLALAAVVCGLTAGAQGPGPGAPGFGAHRPPLERALGPGPGGRWWNDTAMIEKLGLSEDQRKNMDDILLQHREKLVDMRGTLEKAELGMEPLMSADTPNEQQILAQIDKIAQARAELEKANARFLLAIRAKLTPDQYRQLQAARAERHQTRKFTPEADGEHFHRQMRPGDSMRPRGLHTAPDGAPEAAPAPPTGPQGLIPQGIGPEVAPPAPPSAEAGAIE